MELSPADRRILKIIAQNIILASHIFEDDVIDPSTEKRVIIRPTLERLLDGGIAVWEWDEAYGEQRLRLTEKGRAEERRSSGAA